MTRWTKLIPVLVCGLALAGCGSDPVGSDGISPTGARMNDGGYGTGANSAETPPPPPPPPDSLAGGYGTGGN